MSALPPIATAKADMTVCGCLLYPQKQTCAVRYALSALGPIADISKKSPQRRRNVTGRGHAKVKRMSSALLRRDRFHQCIDHLIDAETRRTLAWWVFLESSQEGRHSPNAVLDQVGVFGEPVIVLIRNNVRPFHGVHP